MHSGRYKYLSVLLSRKRDFLRNALRKGWKVGRCKVFENDPLFLGNYSIPTITATRVTCFSCH